MASVTGGPGTGKSYFTRHTILAALSDTPAVVITYAGLPEIWRDVPVIDPAKKESWEFGNGLRQVVWYQHEDATIEYIYRYFRNGVLIFDDCKEYMSSNLQENRYFKRIFSSHRHLGLDIIIIAHSPNDVPPQSWMYNKMTVIFATDDTIRKNAIRTASAPKVMAAQERVNARFSKAYRTGKAYGIYEVLLP
ncbi:MAG: ATP-binding protein [Lewinella sp.]|nr:ATP-binding protein [Lewinella sp.]